MEAHVEWSLFFLLLGRPPGFVCCSFVGGLSPLSHLKPLTRKQVILCRKPWIGLVFCGSVWEQSVALCVTFLGHSCDLSFPARCGSVAWERHVVFWERMLEGGGGGVLGLGLQLWDFGEFFFRLVAGFLAFLCHHMG